MSTDVHAKATQHETERDEVMTPLVLGIEFYEKHKIRYEGEPVMDFVVAAYQVAYKKGIAAEKKRSEGLVEALEWIGQTKMHAPIAWRCEKALEKYRAAESE